MTVVLPCFEPLQPQSDAALRNKYAVLETKQGESICERKFKKRVCWKNRALHHVLLKTCSKYTTWSGKKLVSPSMKQF